MICLEDVSVDLGDSPILHGLTFQFKSGLNFLIGLNGSGKTTLLKCITQDVAYQGTITLNKQNLKTLSPKAFAHSIAIVHQTWDIPFRYKVMDFVMMGRFPFLAWWGSYQKSDYEKVREELHRMEVSHLAQRTLDEVSGGELQRVLLARALCQRTPLLLLDEPAQSLDPKGRVAMYRLLKKLASDGKTIICTSHDIDLLQVPDVYIWAIKDGKLIYQLEGSEFTQSVMEDVYDINHIEDY